MNSRKRQKDRTLKDELPRLVGAQYAGMSSNMENSGEITPEIIEMEPKQKPHPAVDVARDEARSDAVKSNTAQEPGMSGP